MEKFNWLYLLCAIILISTARGSRYGFNIIGNLLMRSTNQNGGDGML